MRFLTRKLALSLLLTSSILFLAGATQTDDPLAIRLSQGRIFINGEQQTGTFSVSNDHFNFLYFYVPARGLFVISNRRFDGAEQAGKFEQRQLQFTVSGLAVKLVSSTPMLGELPQPAWVRYDAGFTLNVQSIMFGYGDSETAPYDWSKQIENHI